MKKVSAVSGDFLVYFHPLTIVSSIFMRNGTYPLMFIGRVDNGVRNGTYPLMFIGRVDNGVRNGTYPLMFIGRVDNGVRNGTYPLMFIGRVDNGVRNGTYPLMFIGNACVVNIWCLVLQIMLAHYWKANDVNDADKRTFKRKQYKQN